MFAIETQNLRKEYGEKIAVEDLTLQVKRGEVFGFLGPNGAGKTTSIKMLLNLVRPTAGQGMLLDLPLGNTKVRQKIGYLPEHFRFHDWLTAGEFLDFHGRLYRMARSRRREVIPPLLELVGLESRLNTKLRAFSKGMTQRIGLAQALLNDPELVFLDEPTSGLDPIGRKLVREIVDGLRAEGTAVFINSHLLSEIEQTCDRVAFIRDGRVLEVNHMSDLTAGVLQLTLRVGQPPADLAAQLAQFGQNVQRNGIDGRFHMTVDGEEKVPQIANWVFENGLTLYELSPGRMTLEERFLQVIGNDSGDG
ncbi:MAG: ABC transporter ATP-binding protein [Ardenticatenaceae bacterium]|nr:ABC transporter ATP-binding protein [Ardenticatenaceae bacterium]